MKHMWSEEELQTLIEEQGGSGGSGSTLDDIVDSNGNKRFVEGVLPVIPIEGLTYLYNKWSLSGTHLMIVLLFANYTNSDVNVSNQTLFSIAFPDYIENKIISTTDGVILKDRFFDFTNDTQIYYTLSKTSAVVTATGDGFASRGKTYRLTLDMLIDSE